MGSASFPRAVRVLRPADFTALRRSASRVGSRNFHVEVAPGPASTARLGLAVSRRVSKRAVERNRLKRLIRDSFRHVYPGLPAVDILVIPRASAVSTDGPALRGELERVWQRVATLKTTPGTGTMRD